MSTSPNSTLAGDFYGTHPQAEQESLPRKFTRTTDAQGAYWREEVVSAAGGGGSSHTTVFPGAGTTFNVAGNTTATITTASRIQAEVDALTTASKIQAELTNQSTNFIQTNFSTNVTVTGGQATALISTASRIQAQVDALTTASKVQTEPVAQPVGAVTLETGTSAHSSFALAVSSNAGSTSLVTSAAGRVRVLSYDIQHTDTGTTNAHLVRFLSSATTIAAPEWLLGQREGVVKAAPSGGYLFQTAAGDALNLDLSTNIKTMAHVVYVRTTA